MAHMIQEHDGMFSVRVAPWHGLGIVIEDEVDSVAAIKAAGLDWELKQTAIHLPNGRVIPNHFANVRSDTQESLGIVTGRYTIVQNQEAFAFTDALVGSGEVKYETAGSLRNGRTVWMLAKLQGNEGFTLLGDKVDTYLCFTNAHDGTGSVRVLVTPIRVVCQNTLNLAIKGAQRAWSTTHVGDISAKFKEAERTLKQTAVYQAGLQEMAEKAASIKVNAKMIAEFLEEVLPLTGKLSDKQKRTVEQKRNGILHALKADDIKRFKGTGFALINAVSDFAGHAEPIRSAPTFYENRFDQMVKGHTLLDQITALVMKAA